MFGPMMIGPSSYAGMGLLGGGVLPNQNQPNQLLQGLMPQQGAGLQGLLGSPVFGAGMNLLAARNDARINPWMAAMQGLQGAQQFRMQNELFKDKRQSTQDEQKYREQMLQLQRERIQQDIARLSAPTTRQRDWEFAKDMAPDDRELYLGEGRGKDMQRIQYLEDLYKNDPEAYQRALIALRAPNMTNLGGGGTGVVDMATMRPNVVVSPEEATEREAELARRKAVASAQGQVSVEASKELVELETQVGQFEKLLNDPSFPGAVGPMDQITGRIGQAFGTPEGVLGARVEKLASEMVLKAGQALSGAMSDEDIKLIKATAPTRGDSPETWNDWYRNIFLQKVAAARRRQQIGGPQAQQSDMSIDDLVNKYANPQ